MPASVPTASHENYLPRPTGFDARQAVDVFRSTLLKKIYLDWLSDFFAAN
jgi:hypothetical protein